MPHPLDFAIALLLPVLIAGSLLVWTAIAARLVRGQPLVPYEPRMAVPWSGYEVATVAILLLLGDAVVFAAFPRTADAAKSVSLAQLIALSAAHLAWVVFSVAYLTYKSGAYFDDMGLDLRRLRADLRLGGLAFLAAVLPVYGLQLLLTLGFGQRSNHPLKQLVDAQPTTGALVVTTIAALAVAPLVEEFLLRVVLQGWLEKKHLEQRERRGGDVERPAGWLPIAITSAIFALLHGWPDQLALFVLALFLGYVYQRTHRIVAPLALHVAVNLLGVLQLWKAYLAGTPLDA